MKNLLVLVDPEYQDGFHGFLEECYKKNILVCIGNNKKNFGINIKSYTSFLSKFLSRSALWMPSYTQIKKILKENDINQIHIIGEPTYLSVFICCMIKKLNKDLDIQITCRTAQNMKFNVPFPFNLVLEFSRKNNVKVFPVSKLSKEYAEEVYKVNTLNILPNGVPKDFFELDIKKNKRRNILFVGSFLNRKGINDFIEIAKRLKDQLSGFNFIAIGGSEKNLEIPNEKDVNFIRFIPWMSREKLIEFYDSSSMLIMPSKTTDGSDMPMHKKFFGKIPWSEQFGRVIIESYSRGTPVLAYDSGAIREYIYDQNHLVEENSIDDLEKKVLEIAKIDVNHDDYINYSKNFKWSKICNKFLEIRNSL